MKLTKYKIKQIAQIVAGGTPSTKNPTYWEGDIPWITPNDLTSYESMYISRGERNITTEGLKNSSAKLLPFKTVLLTTRAPVGYVALAGTKVSTNQGFKNLICDENKAAPEFIYYLLKKSKSLLQAQATGSTFGELSSSRLSNIEVNLPELTIQKKVASILSAYDDLIDINRRRIKLLEEAARLLYREWFVYFRFPGPDKVKIVNGVPEGWKKKKLVEIAYITMGQSPKSENYNNDGIGLPFHQGVTCFGNRYPSRQTYCTQKNRVALYNDVLFSVRAPVGRINISIEKIIIGRGLSAIRSKDNHQSFLFYELKNHFFKEDMIGGGAIFAAITKSDLENVSIMYPDEKTIEKFENISKPIDRQIENLTIQTQKLSQARDLLLPRLMSGRIEV